MSQQPQPQYQLLVTAADKANLVKLLNRVPTTGIDEAKMLLAYAQGISDAPVYVAPEPKEAAAEE